MCNHLYTHIIFSFFSIFSPLSISPDNLLEDHFDDTLDDDVIDDGHEEIDLNDPVERPPEPTVPDERVASSSDEELPPNNNLKEESSESGESGESGDDEEGEDDHDEVPQSSPPTMTSKMTSTSAKESETTRKISSLLSELVGDHPSGEAFANREIVR